MDIIEKSVMLGNATISGYFAAEGEINLAIYTGAVAFGMAIVDTLYNNSKKKKQEQKNKRLSELEFEVLKKQIL